MRLIDADLLKEDLSKFYDGLMTAKELIDSQPTVELLKEKQPIEIQSNGYGLACCPVCDAIIEDISSNGKRVGFCRICGQPIKWKDGEQE